jgi:hypothetical protein
MTESAFETIHYETQDRQVCWQGIGMAEGNAFDSFLTTDVASRLYDEEGVKEFEAHLRGLASTGFANNSLGEILAAEIPEERDWAVGEAMAEAYLTHKHDIAWPWNMKRDKRTPKASLPGADLVGFEINGADVRLVLGEAKSSSEKKYPPQVMSGRYGHMGHQLDNLANNLGLIYQLFYWLLPRCKGNKHEKLFNAAISLYLNSGNKAVALFGILIRDTEPNELDLQARGRALADMLQAPTTCQLIALHLPCEINSLPARTLRGKS